MSRYAIGMDVGGTSARFGLLSETGEVLFQTSCPTGLAATGAELLDQFRQGVREALASARDRRVTVSGVGIAMPAFVDDQGAVAGSCNLPGLNGVAVARVLESEFRLPVGMENDVSAGAYGEYYFGEHAGSSRRMLFLSIGTGIGGGMIVDGKLLRVAQGCLGDPGHVIVDPSGQAPCRCGGNGCLEAVASGWALVEQAQRMGINAIPREIFEGARAGHAALAELARRAAIYTGVGLATLCVLFNPDLVVLGGGVAAEAGESFRRQAERTLRAHAVPFFSRQVKVRLSQAGPAAGLLGAAALILFQATG
ncbi:MAG: ROK family protein [Acidobacteria bacterium]|nr:ROK family protein [Acidobacteriota bacterium]